MATTWLRPLHIRKDRTILQSIMGRTDYAKNPEKTIALAINDSVAYAMNSDKTEDGELVAGYACDPRTVDEEFLLAKREYEYLTGRDNGKKNIIAYHVRQAFKPGEITPQEALDVGYELAERFTKGKHAFIVAVHTNKAHIHCHIVFNSTSIDCTRKFNNFWGSSFAVRRLSDLICLEHGLSVIEHPKPSKGKNYGKWLGDKKKPSHKEILKQKIDETLPLCATFEDFLAKLTMDGYEVNTKRKHISVKAPDWGKPIRLDTLKDEYTEAAIRARLGREKIITSGGESWSPLSSSAVSWAEGSSAPIHVSLLVDIQAKIREGKGEGYAQWAKIFNLKQAAKTLIFLQENGIDSYEDLKKKSSSASAEFAALTANIKDKEKRMSEVSELQKYIGQYGKTRDIYAKYKASGWSRDFYDEHAAEIILHRAAKKFFDGLGLKKLPSINQLKQEYATLATEKKKLYANYHELKASSRALSVAKGNADRILGITLDRQNRDRSHEHSGPRVTGRVGW